MGWGPPKPTIRRVAELRTPISTARVEGGLHRASAHPTCSIQELLPDVFNAFERILASSGLLQERYRLVPAQLRPVPDWMAYYGRFWDEHLERLENHLTKRDE